MNLKTIIFVFKVFFKYYPLIDGEYLENMLRYAIFKKKSVRNHAV